MSIPCNPDATAAFIWDTGVAPARARSRSLSSTSVKHMTYQLKESPVKLLAVGCLIAATLASCSTLKIGSDYDKQASFAGYHTFTMMQRQHLRVRNPLVVSRAQDAIVADLRQKGYQETTDPATADFSVDFTIGSRERTDINSYPEPYAMRGWAGWGWG